MSKLIWVQPGRNDGRVALSETHPDHPNGEAWVANQGQVIQVARTPLVERKLTSGDLVEVAAPDVAPAPPARKTKAEVEAEIAAARGEVVTPPAKPALPWEGYGDLSAEQVVARLPELDDAGRAAVLAYEQSKGSRGRKSIIDALAPAS